MSFNQSDEPPADPGPWQDQAPPAKGSKGWIVAAGAAAVVVVLTVGGVVAVSVLGGGGPQPEDALPANAIAFAKLDLDPSAGQKLAVFELSSKFPEVKSKVTTQETSIKESTLGSIFTGTSGMGLNYRTDVAPWLGDRVGVGVFPDLDADKKPEVGLAIAFTDQSAARVALDKAVANAARKGTKVGYAFGDDYVIVSDTTSHATALALAGKAHPLAGTGYAEDVKKLGSDQIQVAWVDLGAAYKAVPMDSLPQAARNVFEKAGNAKISGRVVEGLHADSSFLELTATGLDLKGASAVVDADPGADSALIESFPSDVLGAVSVSGLGTYFGDLYSSVSARPDSTGILSALNTMGIDSAQKVETLLGSETGVLVGGNSAQPQVAVRTSGSNPDEALAIATSALAGVPVPGGLDIRKITGPPGIVVGMRSTTGSASDLTASIFNKSGSRLGNSDAFRQVIPAGQKTSFVAYVNLAKVVPLVARASASASDTTLASLKPLSALGMSFSGGSEPLVRLRLSFR